MFPAGADMGCTLTMLLATIEGKVLRTRGNAVLAKLLKGSGSQSFFSRQTRFALVRSMPSAV
jgi:hypothetical protein